MFGAACKIARKKYHRALNTYNITKSYQAKLKLNHESKQYKQAMNKYIKMYKIEKIKRLSLPFFLEICKRKIQKNIGIYEKFKTKKITIVNRH